MKSQLIEILIKPKTKTHQKKLHRCGPTTFALAKSSSKNSLRSTTGPNSIKLKILANRKDVEDLGKIKSP